MLRIDEINKIRKAFFEHGESRNSIAIRFNRSWDTVNKIVSMNRDELKLRGKRPNRKPRVLTPEVSREIEALLDEEIEKRVKRKQKYTANKIFEILTEKGIYKGSLRRIQVTVQKLRNKRGQTKNKSFLPLHFPLGSSLQIDHGEADLEIDGYRYKGYLFVASVPGEVLRYRQIFPTKSQEAWGEFHERAFRFFGGSFPQVIYDNDSVLVKKVIGNERDQTDFSLSMEEHFGFESHFCNLASGNEKGAVENGVGYCRRNFLAGAPSYTSWDEVNQHLHTCCLQNIRDCKHYKSGKAIFLAFKQLEEKLEPLPPKKDWIKSQNCRVNSCQLLTIENHDYSVPERYVGTNVRIALGVFDLKVFKDEELIARHKRQYTDSDSLNLNHYLEQLGRKPSAFWDCKAVHNHEFDKRYLEIWRRLSEKYTKKEENQHFIKILLLRRNSSEEALLDAIEVSLKYGAIDHSAVEHILRQQEAQYYLFDEEAMRNELKGGHLHSWDFDLSPYAELCREVQS